MVLMTANESVTIIVVVFVVAVLVVDIDIMMMVLNESDLINVRLLWTQTSFSDLFCFLPSQQASLPPVWQTRRRYFFQEAKGSQMSYI